MGMCVDEFSIPVFGWWNGNVGIGIGFPFPNLMESPLHCLMEGIGWIPWRRKILDNFALLQLPYTTTLAIATTATGVSYRSKLVQGEETRVMCVELVANRFLRKMVRVLVATSIREAAAGAEDDVLLKLMEATCRRATAPPAPPEGLCLVDVGYTEFTPKRCIIRKEINPCHCCGQGACRNITYSEEAVVAAEDRPTNNEGLIEERPIIWPIGCSLLTPDPKHVKKRISIPISIRNSNRGPKPNCLSKVTLLKQMLLCLNVIVAKRTLGIHLHAPMNQMASERQAFIR
ncbi:tRNA pseudouridine synthase A [Senna tora]|uniref:tRNA pseudouridine synthase n=1 Tax=Senna tora TaxID=362788 RepID=A0A834TQV1_9FABA|nr:tRNA pseudouridine synthase A [Senna tora]